MHSREQPAHRELDMPYAERAGRSKLSVMKDGVRFFAVLDKTVLLYRPSRALGVLALVSVRGHGSADGQPGRLLLATPSKGGCWIFWPTCPVDSTASWILDVVSGAPANICPNCSLTHK